MRDAFGGVFMMRLMLVFIVIFVGFGAVSFNYAKAFRIKNIVIDVVEQMELQKSDFGLDENNNKININKLLDSQKGIKDKLDAILEDTNYTITCNGDESSVIKSNETDIGVCYRGIYIIINNEHKDNMNIYYNVITYGGWNLNALNMLLALGGKDQNSESTLSGRWKITGEAKVAVPFSDFIKGVVDDGKRCYGGKWVTVIKCQPRITSGGQCLLEDGTLVLRHALSYGKSGCGNN